MPTNKHPKKYILQKKNRMTSNTTTKQLNHKKSWFKKKKQTSFKNDSIRKSQPDKKDTLIKHICPNHDVLKKLPQALQTASDKTLTKIITQSQSNITNKLFDNEIKKLILQNNVGNLKNLPVEHRDIESCLEAVTQDGLALNHVPYSLRDYEMSKVAIEQNGLAIQFALKNILTPKLCEIAIKQNIHALQFIPNKFKNLELYLIALYQNPIAYIYMPDKHKTKDIISYVVLNYPMGIQLLSPEERTDKLWIASIKKWSSPIEFCREDLLTQELCQIAVEKDWNSLKYISKKFRNTKLYLTALKQNGLALQHISPTEITEELCWSAILQNSEALEYVPNKYKTKTLCLASIRKAGWLIYWVPESTLDQELIITAIENFPPILETINSKHKTNAFYKELLKKKLIREEDIDNDIDIKLHYTPTSKTDKSALFETKDNVFKTTTSYHHATHLFDKKFNTTTPIIASEVYNNIFTLIHRPLTKEEKDLELYPNMEEKELKMIKNGTVIGRRTIQNKQNYFKIWKIDETLTDFTQESHTLAYLKEQQHKIGLKSEIPVPISITITPLNSALKTHIQKFKNPPQIFQDNITERQYCLAYHYIATKSYGLEVHLPKPKHLNHFFDTHKGLLNGIHDIGRLAKHGILHTHSLRQLQSSNTQKDWLLMKQNHYESQAPKNIPAWCTQTTDYSCFNYNGLKEYTHLKLFGTISENILENKTDHPLKFFNWISKQKSIFYNAMNASILFALLLYARIHRNDSDFHHSYKKTVKETSTFIHKILTHYLNGYLENKQISPHTYLLLDKEKYQSWLDISSKRFIYWTEKQDQNEDCYTQHLIKNGILKKELYPNAPFIHPLPPNLHPEIGWIDSEGEPSLGVPNGAFPLMNLAEGLALLSRQLDNL